MRVSDEEYVFNTDSFEKKRNARGYHQMNRKGKGRVRFPDDNLTRKEKAALSKDLGTYKLGEPVYWKEFKTWPEKFQKEYFAKLDEKFNVGSEAIGKMMGVSEPTIRILRKNLEIPRPRGGNAIANARRVKEFENWVRTFRGVDISETPYETKKVVERPSQTEKFNLRYSYQGVEKEPLPTYEDVAEKMGDSKDETEPNGQLFADPAEVFDPMEVMFRAYNIDEHMPDILGYFTRMLEIFRHCPEVQIEIKAPARKNPPPAGKESGRELNDKGQPRVVGFGK